MKQNVSKKNEQGQSRDRKSISRTGASEEYVVGGQGVGVAWEMRDNNPCPGDRLVINVTRYNDWQVAAKKRQDRRNSPGGSGYKRERFLSGVSPATE
jgi:hypothetical protein